MSEVIVYTTEPCGYCMRVKGLLGKRGVSYSEINLSRDPEGRLELMRRTGMMTFPQVLVDGELLGGYHETAAAAANGRLDDLLGPARKAAQGQ